MAIKESTGRKVFNVINMIILTLITLICIVPFIHLLALAFSSGAEAAAGGVGLLPKNFSTEAFKYVAQKKEFFQSTFISTMRVVVGTAISMGLVILTAYPLSKEQNEFKGRTAYVWFFAITMFFNGGLIPTYMIIKELNLINSFWVFVLPGAMNVWNAIILLNFFRQIPKSLEEAAIIDGANKFTVLTKIFLPLSLPALATLTLFTAIGHWNAWFDGVMYINSPDKYPLQTYLSTLVIQQNISTNEVMTPEQLEQLSKIGDSNLRAAQIFLGSLPIMLVYPFLQKYFVKGLTIGGVKE
nr:carbohydrate ABC transporter permease [uncultured Niameybacter sp.]